MAAGEEGDEGLSSTQEAEVGAWVVDWKGAILMEGREGGIELTKAKFILVVLSICIFR